MRRSLVRRAGHVGVAVAAMFATSLLALPVTSAAAGSKSQAAAVLQVQKIVGYQSETGFTIHVVCSKVESTDVQADSYLPDVYLPYNSDGTPDDSTPIPYWDVVDGTWEHDFWHGGVTCTATETDQGDAVLVRYSCSWDSGDQQLGAQLQVENPGCPGTDAGPSFFPDEGGTVTLEGCGDSAVLTVTNDLFDPTVPEGTPGTPPSGNPPVTTTTAVPPVTPVTAVTPVPPRVAPAAAAVVAAARFTG